MQQSFATVERLVRACRLEMRVHLEKPDTSDADLAASFLSLTPRQRLDILPRHALVNAERLANALRSLDAVHVGSGADAAEPAGVDYQDFVEWREVRSFDTAAGRIDVVPVAAGIGTFDDNRDTAVAVDLDGFEVFAHRSARRSWVRRGEGAAWRGVARLRPATARW